MFIWRDLSKIQNMIKEKYNLRPFLVLIPLILGCVMKLKVVHFNFSFLKKKIKVDSSKRKKTFVYKYFLLMSF